MLDPCWKKGFWGLALRFYSQALISVHCLLPEYRGNGIIWPPHLPRLHASHYDRKCPSDCKTGNPFPTCFAFVRVSTATGKWMQLVQVKTEGQNQRHGCTPTKLNFRGQITFLSERKELGRISCADGTHMVPTSWRECQLLEHVEQGEGGLAWFLLLIWCWGYRNLYWFHCSLHSFLVASVLFIYVSQ